MPMGSYENKYLLLECIVVNEEVSYANCHTTALDYVMSSALGFRNISFLNTFQ